MHVIWKRPDGYLGASPSDYTTINLDEHFRLWLHKHDQDSYPFRVSGGWEAEELTVKLNNLVNLLGQADEAWMAYLGQRFSETFKDDPAAYCQQVIQWLQSLSQHLKGDSWEVEILEAALKATASRLNHLQPKFLHSSDEKPNS